jgi:hypothetical protein
MADKPIDQRVKDIIVEQLGVKPDQVTPEAKFIEDLGADSLDTVELIMALGRGIRHRSAGRTGGKTPERRRRDQIHRRNQK